MHACLRHKRRNMENGGKGERSLSHNGASLALHSSGMHGERMRFTLILPCPSLPSLHSSFPPSHLYRACGLRSHIDSALWTTTARAVYRFSIERFRYRTFLENCDVYHGERGTGRRDGALSSALRAITV